MQVGSRRLVGIIGFVLLAIILVNPLFINAFAQAPKVPVIILFKEKPTDKHVNLVKSNGGEITRTYNIINGFAANIPQDKVEKLKSDPLVISVDSDVEVKAFDINADVQIRADQVWAVGDTGQAIPVAILDTGIDSSHPEFSGRILQCHSEITNTNACNDQNGHGTHVAGIAGAAGCCAVPNDAAKGVAPALSFYIDQVLNKQGSGTISGVIAGIDWSVANGGKVISMSLGTSPISTTEPNCDTVFPSLTTAINNAVVAGLTVVAAAGNSGTSGVGAPACISSTIAVGAVDSTDTIADFSSQGGPMTDHGIVAPGVNIYSTWLSGGYATLSGTSMATPHVSGTIALMLKANSNLSPTTIRSTLFSTACTGATTPSCPTGTVPNSVYGYGRVDALRAYNAVAAPTPSPSPTLSSISVTPANPSIVVGSTQQFTATGTYSDGSTKVITTVTWASLNTAVASISSTGLATALSAGTATITATSGTVVGSTTLTVTATATAPALSVTVSTDPSYTQNSWALIKVTVKSNSSPVSGASVTVTVTDPKGGTAQGSGTTDANGNANFKYKIGPNAPLGTYTVAAQASATGYTSGSGSTTFSVT